MRNRVALLLLLTFALSPQPASADPLRITSGVFIVDIELDILNFSGDGISLTTDPELGLIHSIKLFDRGGGPSTFPEFAIEAEGQLIDWGFATTGGEQLLGRGNVVLGGVSASNVDFVGSMQFDAVPTPLVSGGSLDFEYVAPFSFEAVIRGIRGSEELFARQFIGRGRVIVNYEGSTNPGFFGFHDDTIRYEFDAAAVPEPGTLLLLGSGVAAAILRRRRRAG
jgi:hypothetical protein